jgi:hypothetical protein
MGYSAPGEKGGEAGVEGAGGGRGHVWRQHGDLVVSALLASYCIARRATTVMCCAEQCAGKAVNLSISLLWLHQRRPGHRPHGNNAM